VPLEVQFLLIAIVSATIKQRCVHRSKTCCQTLKHWK